MDVFTFNCWTRSQDAGGIFQVEISRSKTVAAFKKAIMNEAFPGVAANTLHLYKPKEPLPRPYEANLSKFILSEHGELLKMGDDRLSEIFPEQPPEHHIHIIVDALFCICWLRGDALSASFQVSIQANATMSQLKHDIKEVQPNLKNKADQHICLYRISGDENELRESLNKTGDGEPLQGFTAAPNFLGVPVLDPILVVVEVSTIRSTNPPLLQHLGFGGTDPIATARKQFTEEARPVKKSPSDGARPSEFHATQRAKAERIPCGRPRDPEEVIPITLLHPVFGQFLDEAQDKSIPMKEDDNQLAGKLANTVSDLYNDEKKRVEAFDVVFKEVHVNFSLYQKIPETKYEMDICLCVDSLPPYFIGEFKNEATSSSEPYMQAIAYYLEATRKFAPEWSKCALPCFLLVAFGPYIVFAGAVWNLRPVVQVLSTPLAFHYHSTDIQNQLTIARHIAAFRNALRTLKTYYEKFMSNGVSEHQSNDMLFPYPADFKSLEDDSLQTICYTKQLMEGDEKKRLIFFGTLKGNPAVKLCIKFTQRYSREVHWRCAQLGFAPRLRGFKKLPGGWYMIVMDDLVDYTLLADLPCGERLPESVFDDIRSKLKELHDDGMVHGDIRDTNILVKKGHLGDWTEFMIIDFDWAGREGDVRYPPYVNYTDIERPKEARDGLPIKAAHDMDMLRFIINAWGKNQ